MLLLIMLAQTSPYSFFFFNDTATTEIYTLSLHDALPICSSSVDTGNTETCAASRGGLSLRRNQASRSEEHTSELQSQSNLVCRLLLEKKKTKTAHNSNDLDRHTRYDTDTPPTRTRASLTY